MNKGSADIAFEVKDNRFVWNKDAIFCGFSEMKLGSRLSYNYKVVLKDRIWIYFRRTLDKITELYGMYCDSIPSTKLSLQQAFEDLGTKTQH